MQFTKSTIVENIIPEAEAGFSSLINSVDDEAAIKDQNASKFQIVNGSTQVVSVSNKNNDENILYDIKNENLILSDEYLSKLSETVVFDLDLENLGFEI